MNKANKYCLGIDLTQHRPLVAIAEEAEIIECKTLADTPPAALLPLIHGESVISGISAHSHRRGTGLAWPPECQVPIYGNYKNGTGRIPLVCAWQKLAKRSVDSFSGILGDTEIGWRPTGEKELSCSSEELIAKSVISWMNQFSNSKVSIIIPDSLGEAAQQALIDHCDAFLVPRPVAVALSWCRNNVNNFNGLGEESEEGVSIGHLLVITMAFDQWEVVPIEIRARIFAEKLWLVPVRNRTSEGGEISRLGASFFFGLASSVFDNLADAWHVVFGSPRGTNYSIEKIVPNKEQTEALRNCVIRGWTEKDRSNLQALDAWKNMAWTPQSDSFELFKEELVSLRNQQLQYLFDKTREKCLGIFIDGACAHIHITENRRLGDFIADAFKPNDATISDGFEAVKGAAYTAAALENGLPCYRETILPIEIHHHRKDKHGDWENAYKLLVEGTTVRAGEEYKSKESVTGLKIQQGENTLNLVLRRSSAKNEKIFRKVSAEIPEKTQKVEGVLISANLRPGQGFAKVTINPERRDAFRPLLLNWKKMEDCEEPPPPLLSYLPQVSILKHDEDMWYEAESSFHDAIGALSNDTPTILNSLKQLRKHINRWPLADSIDQFRGRRLKGDIFLHYSVFPSDGNLEDVTSPHLAHKFVGECESYFIRRGISTKKKESVQRTASWSYLACPSTIIESVRQNIKQNMADTSKVDLHTIGLCFEKPDDIKIFFAALEQLFQIRQAGLNYWLRAIRNIVRFRDHALQPEIISRSRIENIISGLLRSLEREVKKSNFEQIYNNCILAILYLLKRRRYEPDFMTAEDEFYKRVDDLFSTIINKKRDKLSKRQFEIVSIALRFLHREASYTDLKGILVEV
ncbi:MAG: hypothetical protein JW787_03650 [Sedimentisphaerales bacterium]|nr:hypothetical protein [Sedimentisphaerales bacterium]